MPGLKWERWEGPLGRTWWAPAGSGTRFFVARTIGNRFVSARTTEDGKLLDSADHFTLREAVKWCYADIWKRIPRIYAEFSKDN